MSRLFQHDGYAAELLIIVAGAALVWLAPPGLIAGAPWVSLKAEKPKSLRSWALDDAGNTSNANNASDPFPGARSEAHTIEIVREEYLADPERHE